MGTRRIVQCIMFILLSLFPSSGSSALRERGGIGHQKKLFISTSRSQKDITTPITTVPTINPTTPTTTIPVINPAISNPDSPPTSDNPMVAPATTTPTPTPTLPSSGGSWCVASQSAAQTALQVALDYACGYGGADCSPIQPGGSCYDPNTIRDHASYAFNSFYQKNPIPNSCNFGGTALITNTDPSYGTCQFTSTSTSSSVLNTTNSSGSTVFGAGPSNPSSSQAGVLHSLLHFFTSACLVMVLLRNSFGDLSCFP